MMVLPSMLLLLLNASTIRRIREVEMDLFDQGHLHGLKICISAPIISHLFFANDNIIFTRQH